MFYYFRSLQCIYPVLFSTLLLLLLAACTSEASYEHRSKKFLELIGSENASLFKAQQFEDLEKAIEQKLETDAAFKKKWEEMKNHEGINFFSTKQSLSFFYHHLYLKTLKT